MYGVWLVGERVVGAGSCVVTRSHHQQRLRVNPAHAMVQW